jgi:oligopeptide/dipeptide ABC transporter ATP-binding protein
MRRRSGYSGRTPSCRTALTKRTASSRSAEEEGRGARTQARPGRRPNHLGADGAELSPAGELYELPIHPYTEALLSAIPIPDPKDNRARHRVVVGGEPPSPTEPPPGCRFHTRCPRATEICKAVEPPLAQYRGGHLAACHHPLNIDESEIAGASRSPLSPRSAGPLLPASEQALAERREPA